jgi:hypothetical protein
MGQFEMKPLCICSQVNDKGIMVCFNMVYFYPGNKAVKRKSGEIDTKVLNGYSFC